MSDDATHTPDTPEIFSSHFILLGAIALALVSTSLPKESDVWHEPEILGTVWAQSLDEISGVAIDPKHPSLIWAHNDSGDRARLFLLTMDGTLAAEVTLEKISPFDAEDLTIGPCAPGQKERCIFLADIGDNRHQRVFITLYRIPLPSSMDPLPKSLTPDLAMNLRYPGGAHDAEALAAHPISGKLHIVHKARKGDSDVFEVPDSAYRKGAEVHELKKRATISLKHESISGRLITAADYSPDGECFILRTYVQIHTWCDRSKASSIETILEQHHDVMRPPSTLQSEALTISPDGDTLYTTSERWPAPLIALSRKR